jgi:uncharacterized repeat protein (TIGR01451 family)
MKTFTAFLLNHLWQLTLVVLLALVLQQPIFAVGTTAGIDITNTATVDYAIGGAPSSAVGTVTFRVDEKIDVNVSWQDAANIGVGTPDTNQVLTYLLTNTGNGFDDYRLSVQNTGIGVDQFDPVLVDIYLDANANGVYNPGVDTQYIFGTNDPVLGADASLAIFVLNNIPASLNGGDLGNSQLTARSNTVSGSPGTAFANAGDNNTTAVVGTSGGSSNDIGIYEVTNATVSLVKSVVISDPLGGNQPMPGATMTYRIDVSVAGVAANNVTITDPIPANTTYTADTLTLNAGTLTDVADADTGDVGDTTPNTVTVDLGNLTPASPVQTITFDVIIN